MGGTSSTETKNETPVEVDNSTGFHVLEIHLPTAGAGLGLLILVVVIIAFAFYIRRKLKDRYRRRQHARNLPTVIYQPYPRFATGRGLNPPDIIDRFQEIDDPEQDQRDNRREEERREADRQDARDRFQWDPLPR